MPSLEQLEKLGKPEKKDRSEMIVLAIKEYVQRHVPGNPQLTFDQKSDLYFPPSAQELITKKKEPKCSRCHQPATRVYGFSTGQRLFTCSKRECWNGIQRQPNSVGWRSLKK